MKLLVNEEHLLVSPSLSAKAGDVLRTTPPAAFYADAAARSRRALGRLSDA